MIVDLCVQQGDMIMNKNNTNKASSMQSILTH